MPLATASPVRDTARPARSGGVYEALKREIMLGDLRPGTPLTELDLAARFGCSQGPVREALLALQQDGLVIRKGHRGTSVSDCTAEEAVEMFRLRQSIECRTVPRAIQRAGRAAAPGLAADLAALVDAMEALARAEDEYGLAEVDREFHRRILREADLPALDPILHRCLIHNHRFKISRSEAPRDLVATARRHLPIVEAVERRTPSAAVAALGHHIATIVDFGPAVFDDAGPHQPGAP
ncbi:GntR family transcriptional regulator [Prosthecomicrobium sp. N25]|uniref:GntR family transcriptional regulator n=1 Tax=Prosthecomicrobium sp. N25 TaxID=3129254 RepID=UPI0030776113